MALEDDIAFFEQVPTFAVLGRQALQVLAIGAETRHLPSGSVLFYAGELTDAAYLVQEGTLSLEPGTLGEQQERESGPGTLLAELALLTDTVAPVTAIAKEPTRVVRISRVLFHKMLEGYPGAAVRLRDLMASRINAWTQELGKVRRTLDSGQ
jgi:CRP-like cAMP-binding protein